MRSKVIKNEINRQYIYERLDEWLFYFRQNLKISEVRRLYSVAGFVFIVYRPKRAKGMVVMYQKLSADRVEQLRRHLRLSYRDLSELSGVPATTIRDYVNGKCTLERRPEYKRKLATAFERLVVEMPFNRET